MNADSIFETPANAVSGAEPAMRERLAAHYGPPLTDAMVARAESFLGVKLPAAYVELLRQINGGFTVNDMIKIESIDRFVQVQLLPGVGYSEGLDSEFGSKYKQDEWEYPEGTLWLTGDGHTGVFFDYRESGPQGEPSVLWLDLEEEVEYTIADNARDFLSIVEAQCLDPIPFYEDDEEEEEDL